MFRSRRSALLAAWIATLLGVCAATGPRSAAAGEEFAATSPEEEFIFSESEIVTAATLAPVRASLAPASVTVVTAEEIRRYGHHTLADLLRHAAGFFVVNDRNYEYVGTRGFLRPGDYNNRILLLVDGHPLNDNWIGASAVGADLGIHLLRAERVEVVRGPGSALYGTNAVFAVVNIVTREAAGGAGSNGAVGAGASGGVQGEAANSASPRARAMIAAEGGGREWGNLYAEVEGSDPRLGRLLLGGSILSTAGEKEISLPPFDGAPEGLLVRDVDGDRARHASLRYTRGRLEVDGLASWRRKVVPTGSFGTVAGDRRARTVDARAFLRARLRTAARGFDVELSLSEDMFHYDGDYPYLTEELPIFSDSGDGLWTTAGVVVRRSAPGGQAITFGGGHQWHRVEQSIWGEDLNGQEIWRYVLPTGRYRLWSVFAQDIVRVARNLDLTVGGRHDHHPNFGGYSTGRAALAWCPAPGTVVKGVYGSAFRAPSWYELTYTDDGTTQVPSPGLEPEEMTTVEFSAERDIGVRGHARLSVFRTYLESMIDLGTREDGLLQYDNTSDGVSRGVEIEGRWTDPRGILAHADLSMQNVTDHEGDRRLANTPRVFGGAGLSVPVFPERLFLSLLVRGMGERPTLDGSRAPASAVADLAILYRSRRLPLEVSLRAQNLLDTRYSDPGFPEHPTATIPQPGRFVAARIVYAF